jgi:hypothetical protein
MKIKPVKKRLEEMVKSKEFKEFVQCLPTLVGEAALYMLLGSEEPGMRTLLYKDPRLAVKNISQVSLLAIKFAIISKISESGRKISILLNSYTPKELMFITSKEIEEINKGIEFYKRMLSFIEKYYDELSSIFDLLKEVRGGAEDYIDYFYQLHYTPRPLPFRPDRLYEEIFT